MSAGPQNPDTRPLPEGWVQQYDSNYRAWFYVNTRETPPRSSWTHPSGPPPQTPPPSQYSPPPGAPGPNAPYGGYDQQRNWGNSPGPQGAWNGPGGGYGGPPQGGYGSSPGYGGYGPQGGYNGPQSGYGGPPQGGYGGEGPGYRPAYGGYPQEGNRGFFGGNQSPQPVVVQQVEPPKKQGIGMGGALLAGGAGLVGGALLADAFEDHSRDEYEEGYDEGRDDQGYQDDDYGGDF